MFLPGQKNSRCRMHLVSAIQRIDVANQRVGIDPLEHDWGGHMENSIDHLRGTEEFVPFEECSFDVALCTNLLVVCCTEYSSSGDSSKHQEGRISDSVVSHVPFFTADQEDFESLLLSSPSPFLT